MGREIYNKTPSFNRSHLIKYFNLNFYIFMWPFPSICFQIWNNINYFHTFDNFSKRCEVFIKMICSIFTLNNKKFIRRSKLVWILDIATRNRNNPSMMFKSFFSIRWKKISTNISSSFRNFIRIWISTLNDKIFYYSMKRGPIEIFLFCEIYKIWPVIRSFFK